MLLKRPKTACLARLIGLVTDATRPTLGRLDICRWHPLDFVCPRARAQKWRLLATIYGFLTVLCLDLSGPLSLMAPRINSQPGLCAAIIMNRPTSFSRPRFPAVCCHTWFSLQQLQVFQQGHRVLVTKLGGGVIGCQASPKFKITYY